MATKRGRKVNKTSYITYEDLEALGFGSWLKKNAGVVGSIAGATIGTLVAPGIGTSIGAKIGGDLGNVVSANEASKEQAALEDKAIKQQNARNAAEAQLRIEMNNAPKILTTPVLANGGMPDDPPKTKTTPPQTVTTPSTTGTSDEEIIGYKIYNGEREIEIAPEEINDFYTFLEMKDFIDDRFFTIYRSRNRKMDEIMRREGLTYDEAAAKYKEETPPPVNLKAEFSKYPRVLSKEMTVDEAYDFFQRYRNRFSPNVPTIIGTVESHNKTTPAQVDYGRRNADTKYEIRPIYRTRTIPPGTVPENKPTPIPPENKPTPIPPENGMPNTDDTDDTEEEILDWKNLYYDPLRKVPNVFRVFSPSRGFLGFVNQTGQFIPYDPKKGEDIRNYKQAVWGWQYMGNDIISEEKYNQSQDKLTPYFVTRNNGRVIITDPPSGKYDYPIVFNGAFADGGVVSPGTINYTGQTHEGPDGGIPIDESGNPTVKNGMNPVATVERGEVAYSSPDFGTYIFSNRLKYDNRKTFADKAKDIQKKYKLRMKDGKINDPISEVGYRKEMEALIEQQEAFREVSGVNREELIKQQFSEMGMPIENNVLPIGANGIYIKPSRRGTFTAAAKKHGMGVQEFARHVISNKEDYSSGMVKKANFARNAAKWNKKWGGGFEQGNAIKSTVGVGIAAIPPLISTLGNVWLLNNMQKRDKKTAKLNYTPIGYQNVDLSKERSAVTESALTTQANLRRNALLTGASAGQILENNINTSLGVQRELGQQLSKSHGTEALENAKIRSETDRFNAMQTMEANKLNLEKSMANNAKYDAIRAAIANSWAQAASDYLTGVNEAKALNMRSENYQLEYSGDKWWKNMLFGDYKIGVKK